MSDDNTSIWKKEIRLRRPKEERAADEQSQESTSIWKKEIRLRRPKLPEPAVGVPPVTAAPTPVRAAARPEPQPQLQQPEPEPEPEQQPQESQSEPAPEPVAQAQSAEPQPVHETAPAEPEPHPSVEDLIAALGGNDEPPALPPAAVVPAPAPAASEPAPAPEPQAPLAPEPLPAPEPQPVAHVEPAPEPAPERESAHEPETQPEPEAVREPEQDTEPVEAEQTPEPAKKTKRSRKHQAKRVVGVKVGASQIAAARVTNNGAVEVHQLVREPLEPGIVVAGEVRDPEALALALKRFFKKHKLPRRGIRLGVSNNRIGVRVLEITGIDGDDQLRNAVRFRAQEVLPIPVDEAVLDFQVVGESESETGEVVKRIVLVVAYRDLVERYSTAFRKAGLKLMGIDLEAFALLRALAGSPDPAGQEQRSGLVVVAVGHDRSTFAVSDGEICEFTRVLDWGGASLDDAVAQALDVSVTEAHGVKTQLSLADAAVVPENFTEEQTVQAREAIRRAVEAFARDLVSSLRFYQSQPDSLAIRELVLSGGTSELPGLAAELERLLDVRVRLGDPLERVKVGRRVKEREQLGSLAAAIGLGIEG